MCRFPVHHVLPLPAGLLPCTLFLCANLSGRLCKLSEVSVNNRLILGHHFPHIIHIIVRRIGCSVSGCHPFTDRNVIIFRLILPRDRPDLHGHVFLGYCIEVRTDIFPVLIGRLLFFMEPSIGIIPLNADSVLFRTGKCLPACHTVYDLRRHIALFLRCQRTERYKNCSGAAGTDLTSDSDRCVFRPFPHCFQITVFFRVTDHHLIITGIWNL